MTEVMAQDQTDKRYFDELVDFANRLEAATLHTIEAGKMTGDLARITTLPNPTTLGTREFILAIRETLEAEAV